MLKLPTLSVTEHMVFVVAGLLVYVLATRIGEQRRHPSAAIAWVFAILAFPYLATPLFLLFGSRKFVRPRSRRPLRQGPGPRPEAPAWALRLLDALDLPGPVANTAVTFQADGVPSLAALVDLATGARWSLAVGTYILGDDDVGAVVCDALAAAARRGVQVRLLLDSVGNFRASGSRLAQLRDAGVEVRRFMPLLHNPMRGRTNLRNHRKLVVTDGEWLWSGGRNLADEYFLGDAGAPPWVDLSFVVRGAIAAQALDQFDADWVVASGRRGASSPVRAYGVAPPAAPAAPPTPTAPGEIVAQWLPSGPDHADDTVHSLLLAAAYHASDRILAATPYFVPDDALLDAWCMACKRGVRVELLLPQRSNHLLADIARERALRRLVESGATVWLLPSMMHAKAVVIDDDLALCGSVNLDGRSLFLNYEVMTAFYGAAEVGWLAGWHAAQVGDAVPYRAERPGWWRDLVEGAVRSVGFQL